MTAYELAEKLNDAVNKNEKHLTLDIEAMLMLRQQADRIAELEKKLQESAFDYISICSQADEHYARVQKLEQVLHAIANDYHELSDHKIEVQNRNHKKWAREALE